MDQHFGLVEPASHFDGLDPPFHGRSVLLSQHVEIGQVAIGPGQLGTRGQLNERLNRLAGVSPGPAPVTGHPEKAGSPDEVGTDTRLVSKGLANP